MSKAAFPYYGGKCRGIKTILPHIPAHHTYVEVFGGAANLLLAKEPAPVEVYNDVNGGVVNFFQVLRDGHEKELVRKLWLTPYSREEYEHCLRTWQHAKDPVERARRWYFVQCNSYAGRFGKGLNLSATRTAGSRAGHVNTYHNCIEKIHDVAERFMNVIVECRDFRKLIPRYDTPNTLMYVDPPYVMETRHKGAKYSDEMTLADHKELIDLVLNSQGSFLISGYDHPLYHTLDRNGWKRIEFQSIASSATRNPARDRHRTEVLWISSTKR